MIANAYDPVVKDFSTGSILYGEIFSDSFESQKKVVHIGEGDSGYKSTWGVNVTPAFEDWIAFRPGPLGTAMRGTFQVARRVQALIASSRFISRSTLASLAAQGLPETVFQPAIHDEAVGEIRKPSNGKVQMKDESVLDRRSQIKHVSAIAFSGRK